jgi:hypothetical protein
VKRALLYLAAGFVLLFGLRLAYGYLSPSVQQSLSQTFETAESRSFEFNKKNYASEKFQAPAATGQQSYNVDQKYEKVASMASRTPAFDQDLGRVRTLTDQHHALVEYEQSSGLEGYRRLELAIGIVPAEFDDTVDQLSKIGKLSSIRVDKTDRTREYRDLRAKQASLEKTRDSLTGLKGRAGKIDELMNLEDRLLDIEGQIQSVGVSLGEFSQENEFCTIKLTLQEFTPGTTHFSFFHRVRVALQWTVTYYLALLAMLLVATLLALAATTLLEKMRWITVTPELKNRA